MAPPKPAETKRRYFSVEEANKTLPLVRAIVARHRAAVARRQRVETAPLGRPAAERKRPSSDPYSEELAQSQAEMEAEEEQLAAYIDELTKLGRRVEGPRRALRLL